MHSVWVTASSASIGFTLMLAVVAVVGIGLAVVWASRNCETNTEAAQRIRSGRPSSAAVPRARLIRRS